MQLKFISRLYARLILLAMVICLASFAHYREVSAQEGSIDPMYLEIDKKYQIPEGWSVLPLELEDPYKRIKNGPILTNVIHKANVEWISKWVANPKAVVPNAKMPDLGLEFDEIKAVIAYLGSIADDGISKVQWDDYLLKSEDDMTDEEYDNMDQVYQMGKGVWSRARCTICHPVKGLGGNVGVGPDLGRIVTKINRDWLHGWLTNTKEHFPDTMMAQFRFSDEEVRGLVEYIMRDTQFMPEEEDEEEEGAAPKAAEEPEVLTQAEYDSSKGDDALILKGKSIIENARCFVCHDIKGFDELMPVVKRDREGLEGFEKVLYDIRCLTCHTIQEKGGTYAPNITEVGTKIKMDWEKDFLKAPDIIRPLSQQMPKFNLTEEDASFATGFMEKYLVNNELPSGVFEDEKPSEEIVEAGKVLFYSKGCNACHADGVKGGGVVGPNLGTVGDRLQPAYMFHHLKNPTVVNPRAIEPNYGFSDQEIKMLVGFLVDHVKGKEGN
ncbi:MAG: c-type cytochrome [Candidatus Kuenenia sp.]|nr:c-type cytochrome [Candidatus Kuenenia hertensis]